MEQRRPKTIPAAALERLSRSWWEAFWVLIRVEEGRFRWIPTGIVTLAIIVSFETSTTVQG